MRIFSSRSLFLRLALFLFSFCLLFFDAVAVFTKGYILVCLDSAFCIVFKRSCILLSKVCRSPMQFSLKVWAHCCPVLSFPFRVNKDSLSSLTEFLSFVSFSANVLSCVILYLKLSFGFSSLSLGNECSSQFLRLSSKSFSFLFWSYYLLPSVWKSCTNDFAFLDHGHWHSDSSDKDDDDNYDIVLMEVGDTSGDNDDGSDSEDEPSPQNSAVTTSRSGRSYTTYMTRQFFDDSDWTLSKCIFLICY